MTLLAGLTPPLSEQAEDIDRVWNVFLIAALVVGVFVWGLIVYAVVRFRRRTTALPKQVRENYPFEIAYTVIPLVIVIALFALTYTSVRAVDDDDADDALVVGVLGFQWGWQFSYPQHDVEVIGDTETYPVLVLPATTTVRFEVTSRDVIHSFWIPGFRYKRDMFPGQVQTFAVDMTDEVGDYPLGGICAEFCGLEHTEMRFEVRVLTREDFEMWLQEQQLEQDARP